MSGITEAANIIQEDAPQNEQNFEFVQWHTLADKIKDDGFDAATLYMLLGSHSWRTKGETFIPFDVKPYDVILFDKVFFSMVRQLEWIATFIYKHQYYHMIISTGDSVRNKPVAQNLAVDFDAYYNEILAMTFPRCLDLKVSNGILRTIGIEWEALYNALRNESLSASEVFETAIEHGLKTMSWTQL